MDAKRPIAKSAKLPGQRSSKKPLAAKQLRTRKLLRARFPILEHDTSKAAVLEPHHVQKRRDVPEHAVICFFAEVLDEVRRHGAHVVALSKSEIGDHPIYEIDYGGRRLALIHPGITAPLGAAILEEAIAFGCRKFIACGGAGVLDGRIPVGHLVVPTSAVRDEGTSYHYLAPAREAKPGARALAAIKSVLKSRGHEYTLGKTWTTDAIYRETRAKIERRKRDGCLTVEMEAAAFFAVAKFRGVEFGQILYAGDDLSGEWDPRNWNRHEVRERLFHLAAESCLLL
jgi:uridine phosphorylase